MLAYLPRAGYAFGGWVGGVWGMGAGLAARRSTCADQTVSNLRCELAGAVIRDNSPRGQPKLPSEIALGSPVPIEDHPDQ